MLRPGAPSTPGRASAFAGKFGETPGPALLSAPLAWGTDEKSDFWVLLQRSCLKHPGGTLMPYKFGVMSLVAPASQSPGSCLSNSFDIELVFSKVHPFKVYD